MPLFLKLIQNSTVANWTPIPLNALLTIYNGKPQNLILNFGIRSLLPTALILSDVGFV